MGLWCVDSEFRIESKYSSFFCTFHNGQIDRQDWASRYRKHKQSLDQVTRPVVIFFAFFSPKWSEGLW